MRKRPIDALFPKTRRQILAATYGQPGKWWFLSELAAFIGVTPSSLQRELKSLCESGILQEKREGNRAYVKAETSSYLFEPLREIFEKTVGVKAVILDALSPLADKIDSAFIYGSVARGEDHSLSDIDIMVIGKAGLSIISKTLRPIEMKFNREFNVSCYNAEEFSRKVKAENHFLTSLLKKDKIFLIGDENELGKLTDKQNGAESHDKPERD